MGVRVCPWVCGCVCGCGHGCGCGCGCVGVDMGVHGCVLVLVCGCVGVRGGEDWTLRGDAVTIGVNKS